MNTYTAYQRSTWRFLICLLLFSVAGCFLGLLIFGPLIERLPDDALDVIFLTEVIILTISVPYLALRAATAKLQVKISNEGMEVSTAKAYLFQKKQKIAIPASEINVGYNRVDKYIVVQLAGRKPIKLLRRVLFIGTSNNFNELLFDLTNTATIFKSFEVTDNDYDPLKSSYPEEQSQNTYTTSTQTTLTTTVGVFAILLLLVLLIAGLMLLDEISMPAFLIYMALVLLALVYVAKYWINKKINITILNDRISIKYIRQPFFDKAADRDIAISDITSYKLITFNGFIFTLYLNDGTKFSLFKGAYGDTLTFYEIADSIIKLINEHNTKPEARGIERKKTIYEGTSGLVIAGLTVAAILVILYALIFLPDNHTSADTVKGIGLIISCLGLIFYIISLRKKKDPS